MLHRHPAFWSEPEEFRPERFAGADADAKAKAAELIRKRMDYLAGTFQGDYLFGDKISVADCYLFVMLLWAKKFDLEPPAPLVAFRDRMMQVPAVETAMKHEGLT